jgi:hypothetical protein
MVESRVERESVGLVEEVGGELLPLERANLKSGKKLTQGHQEASFDQELEKGISEDVSEDGGTG